MSVCLCVCPSVCLCVCSLLRYRLTVFLPPLPKVGCPIFLEIRNPWEKVMERSGLRYEHFCFKIVENRRAKKTFFPPLFSLFFDLLRFSVFFNDIFAPTSQSRMSNIFRDLKSLGKTNGKKWSQIWKFLFENCLKSPHKKKVFFFTFFGLLWFLVFFNDLFAPTSRSWMSNIFRDSESLGKSYGKKWSQIWTFLFENCLKSPRKKKFFFFIFLSLLRVLVFFNGLFAPTSWSRMSNIFRDSESLGKINGKKWSNIWTFLFGSGLKLPHIFFSSGFALVHPPMASVLLSASVERCFVSRMRDFLLLFLPILHVKDRRHCNCTQQSNI